MLELKGNEETSGHSFYCSGFCLAYLFAFILKNQKTPPTPLEPNWREYKDPDNFFSIDIPTYWNVTQDAPGTVTSGPVFKFTHTVFKDPTGAASVEVSVTETGKQYMDEQCEKLGTLPTPTFRGPSFGGVPSEEYRGNIYTLSTNTAAYQIDYVIHNHLGGWIAGIDRRIGVPTPTIVPLPQNAVQRNAADVPKIVASFMPIPAIPQCQN